MNLEEHVIKKEGKMKIMSSLPSVFVDTRQSCHVIDPSLEMGLSHWPSRALSLSLRLSLSPAATFSSPPPLLPPDLGGSQRVAARLAEAARHARAGCGGERRARWGRPLLLPAARHACARRSRGTPAMTRPGRRSRPTRTTSDGRPSPLAPPRTRRRLPPSCSGDGRDHDGGGGDQERGSGGGSSNRRWQGPRRRRLRLLRVAMPDNGAGGGGQWCRRRRHTRLFFFIPSKFVCRVLQTTRQRVCRVPDKWHMAKDIFADVYLLCVVCRVQHTGPPVVVSPSGGKKADYLELHGRRR